MAKSEGGEDETYIHKMFDKKHGGRGFNNYYVALSYAERAKVKWDWDKDRTELDTAIMKEAVGAAIREKLKALGDMDPDDVPDEMYRMPDILGGGFADTEYSQGDEYSGGGVADSYDIDFPTPTPRTTRTPTPTWTPIPTATYQPPSPFSPR